MQYLWYEFIRNVSPAMFLDRFVVIAARNSKKPYPAAVMRGASSCIFAKRAAVSDWRIKLYLTICRTEDLILSRPTVNWDSQMICATMVLRHKCLKRLATPQSSCSRTIQIRNRNWSTSALKLSLANQLL